MSAIYTAFCVVIIFRRFHPNHLVPLSSGAQNFTPCLNTDHLENIILNTKVYSFFMPKILKLDYYFTLNCIFFTQCGVICTFIPWISKLPCKNRGIYL